MNDKVELIIKDSDVPKITVNGKKFWIISCSYMYHTKSDKDVGVQELFATGYIDGEQSITSIRYDCVWDEITIRKD